MTTETASLHPQSITLALHLMERMLRHSRRHGVRAVCFDDRGLPMVEGMRAFSEGILDHVPGATPEHRDELARLLQINLVDIRRYEPPKAVTMIKDGVAGLR